MIMRLVFHPDLFTKQFLIAQQSEHGKNSHTAQSHVFASYVLYLVDNSGSKKIL
jgi:hypothetical protein